MRRPHCPSSNGRMVGRIAYNVTARRNGQGWTVKVDGVEGVAGGFAVGDLSEIEVKARRHIFGYTARPVDGIELDVDVVIPAAIEQRLQVAEQLIEDAGGELKHADAELCEVGCSRADVEWLFAHRSLRLGIVGL